MLRRFAERKGWTLGDVQARLSATEGGGQITGVEAELLVSGALDDEQIASLREAARTCRISRALSVPVDLRLACAA